MEQLGIEERRALQSKLPVPSFLPMRNSFLTEIPVTFVDWVPLIFDLTSSKRPNYTPEFVYIEISIRFF